nr:MAG TPA: hypothetical protein [Caudoviricetes sp.]
MEILNLMTQKEMNDTFIAAFEGIKGVCDKITTGNVSHNVATIRCKCVEMLQFFKDWNKCVQSAADEVMNGIKPLQWKKHPIFGLFAKTELNIYCIDETKKGVCVYMLLLSDFYEDVSSVEEAKRLANENYRGKIKQILGL